MIMSKAYMLKNTPFSVCYDLPKEINEARKKLWDELKSIKANRPRAKFQILYPAKLIVDGETVRDEFPNWSEAIKESRLTDFSHIDTASFQHSIHFLSNEEGRGSVTRETTRDSLFVNTQCVMNGNSSSARDQYCVLNMPAPGPSQPGPLQTSGIITMDRNEQEKLSNSNSESVEMQVDQTVPLKTIENAKKGCESVGDRSVSPPIFRPYSDSCAKGSSNVKNSNISTANESNSETQRNRNLPKRNPERISRTNKRCERRE